jgi:hypothetical protein
MSMDETVAEYTEAKTAARKGGNMYPVGGDVFSNHIIFTFVDVMGLDDHLIQVKTYS